MTRLDRMIKDKIDKPDSRELEEYDDYLDDGIVWDIRKHGYSYAD